MVYYRKYRPQLISELDLTAVREKLTAILKSDSIPHAFLFAGPKGLGKTSSARILAKAINCTGKKKGDFEPCNTCPACISVTNGSAVDVLEIDAASNRGIDEIRDLRERIKFSPAVLSKKVYIIDEVHMLTTEAFNALLKTLEEPPSHVVFILATTELSKLPETIISRAFYVPFEKPGKEELSRSLSRVADGEGLKLEPGVLDKIAELSDGAFRDGAKILEEVSLQSKDKNITLDILEFLYKTGSMDAGVTELIALMHKKETEKALKVVDSLASKNTDFKVLIELMANKLHKALLETALKGGKDLSSLQELLRLLDEAYKSLKGAVLPQLPLELAIIEYGLENETQLTVQKDKPGQPSVPAAVQESSPEKPAAENEPSAVHDKPASNNTNSGYDLLNKIISSVNLENKILAGLLRGCRVEEADASRFVLKAPSTFHLQKLTELKNKTILNKTIEEVLGKTVAIEIKS